MGDGGTDNDNAAGNDNVVNGNDNGDDGALRPVFPDDYRETFTEVRDCRFGAEHGGIFVRVLANDVAVQPYRDNAETLPEGSLLVKEEYDGLDCADDANLFQWRVMLKEAPGFDTEDGDWHWQRVLVDGTVVEDTKASCIACHSAQVCVDRDYMCTLPSETDVQ